MNMHTWRPAQIVTKAFDEAEGNKDAAEIYVKALIATAWMHYEMENPVDIRDEAALIASNEWLANFEAKVLAEFEARV
jgi:hypothetical protein